MKKEERIYKRSIIILSCKKILITLKLILPTKWYDVFYKFNFNIYKNLLHIIYYKKCIYYKIKGDRKNYKKANLIYQVMPYSLVGSGGLSQTYDIVTKVIKNDIEGDIIECGVARGGCAALMASIIFKNNINDRKLWLFDSFEGLPEASEKDFSFKNKKSAGKFIRPLNQGSCLGTYEQVENLLFSKLNMNRKNIKMIKGWFKNTLPEYKNKIDKISVLRIDADWYESTKCCLENLYNKVIKDGFIIIDDYGTCFGAKRAVDEFLKMKKLSVKLTHDGRGGCCFKKPV